MKRLLTVGLLAIFATTFCMAQMNKKKSCQTNCVTNCALQHVRKVMN